MTSDQSASAWIEVSSDGKTAWLNNIEGEQIPREMIESELAKAGVLKGISDENLEKAVRGEKLARYEHIADQIPPQKGEDARIEYLITHEVKPVLREDGTINFREINLVKNVSEDEPLLRKFPPTIGPPGYLITGEEIPGRKGRDVSLKRYRGEGAKISKKNENFILAARPGAYKEMHDGKVAVYNIFEVRRCIDFATGNIHSTSSVSIGGDVRSGFSIESKGDVTVRGLIENAAVDVKGDLNVQLGIVQGTAPVIVEGFLNAKYIYNRPLIQAGEVTVAEMISNSNMRIEGDLTAKKLVGGEAVVKGNILLEMAGSVRRESKTVLVAGLDLKKKEQRNDLLELVKDKEEDKRKIEKEIAILHKWAKKVESKSKDSLESILKNEEKKYGHHIKEKIEKQLETLKRCRQDLDQVKEFIRQTMKEITRLNKELANPDATVTVSGTVFAGVSVAIGEAAPLELKKSLKRVVFKTDKDGKVVMTSLP